MRINIRSVLTGKTTVLPISYSADMQSYDFYGVKPFPDPVSVEGTLNSATGVCVLQLTVKATAQTMCASCGKSISVPMDVPVEYTVVQSLPEDADECDYLVCPDGELELDDVSCEAISLAMDPQPRCKPDCKGRCFTCGADLNTEVCRCTGRVDPELAKLKDFIPTID